MVAVVQAMVSHQAHASIIMYARYSCKIEAISILERGYIYGIIWHIEKLKLSNELEHRGIYRMTYNTYTDIYMWGKQFDQRGGLPRLATMYKM